MVTFALPTCDTFSGPADAPSSPVDSDALLMLQARQSVAEAFTAIVQRHQQSLMNFFSRHGARDDSEDLVQETFIRLHRSRDRYEPTAKFSTYLYTLARHAWVDHGRKVMRRERYTAAYEQECALNEAAYQTEFEPCIDLEATLAQLSAKHREVIDLYFYQGLRLQEIATRLRIPLGTVKSRLNLAMTTLRDQIASN